MTTRREQRAIEARLLRMAHHREARKARTFNRPCPTCYAEIGEPCITRNGGRTAQHITRREA